jgi:hypothetical protein
MYRIRPLEWRLTTDCNDNDHWHAATVFGGMAVYREQHSGWGWGYCFEEYYDEAIHCCESAEDGKQQAEAFYLSRLLPALEPAK